MYGKKEQQKSILFQKHTKKTLEAKILNQEIISS